MVTPNLEPVEPNVLEERTAMLKAVPCPGKTHALIKNPALRDEFAKELNDWRNQRNRSKREGRSHLSRDEWNLWRGGLESAFWALQKAENRMFLYQGRRMSWQMVADTPKDERYKQYEAAVIAAHKKALKILAEIETDFEAGKIDDIQRLRRRRMIQEKEDDKVKALQLEYGL